MEYNSKRQSRSTTWDDTKRAQSQLSEAKRTKITAYHFLLTFAMNSHWPVNRGQESLRRDAAVPCAQGAAAAQLACRDVAYGRLSCSCGRPAVPQQQPPKQQLPRRNIGGGSGTHAGPHHIKWVQSCVGCSKVPFLAYKIECPSYEKIKWVVAAMSDVMGKKMSISSPSSGADPRVDIN